MRDEVERVPELVRRVERAAWLDMFAAAPTTVRRRFEIQTMQAEHAAYLACPGLPGVPFNRAFAVSPSWMHDEREASNGIQWLAEHAAESWVVQADVVGGNEGDAAMKKLGLRPTGAGWSKLVLAGSGQSRADSIDVRVVETKDHAALFASVVIDGFGFPIGVEQWFAELALRTRWTAYVAFEGDAAAAAGVIYTCSDGAWLGIDTTIPAYRGRGMQKAIISRRLDDVRRAHIPFAMAETGREARADKQGTSFRNYLRSSFLERYVSLNYST